MAGALVQAVNWSPALLADTSLPARGADEFACECVFTLVRRSRSAGVTRREFSLASKVLHWLLPYRVPAYDSYICRSLGIRGADDHPERAYHEVACEELGAARAITGAGRWLGAVGRCHRSARWTSACGGWAGEATAVQPRSVNPGPDV
jgi:hypothetical protein